MIRHPGEVAAAQVALTLRAAAQSGRIDPRDAVLASVTASYFFLRRGLSGLGFAFPILLWLGAGPHHLQTSISAYYHYAGGGPVAYGGGVMRDVFVGILWTVGAFLFFYKGYSRLEDWVLNLAGLASAAIASFPMDWPPDGPRSWTGNVHQASAFAFFAATAFVCLVCSGETLQALKGTAAYGRFKHLYRLIGTSMIAVPVSVVALHYAMDRPEHSYVVLGLEVGAIWTFAAYWLVKSREIEAIEALPATGNDR